MDYNSIAKKYGATESTAPKVDYASLAQKFGGTTVAPSAPTTTQPTESGGVGGFLKSLVSAPATLVARPFQAVAELAGASPEAVDKFSSKYSGGLVAPVPQNASDVVKDVGRGVQTVAYGVGAPLAAGAAFGAGSSLESQGSDALTTVGGITNTLTSTLLGMGAGKALELVGKPLLNAAGKVIGTITPKTLQDVAAKGSDAVANFMAHHEILPGGLKESVAKIPEAAQKFDTGVGKLFKGGGDTAAKAIQSQYPGLTKDNVAKHYENIEVKGLMEPVKMSGPTFKKAIEVANDATKRGINLEKLAADNKIYKSDHIVDGKFSTAETANALRDEAMSGGKEILRPALAAADPSVPAIPVAQIRNEMLSRLGKIPDAKLSPEQKLKFARNIAKEYGDGSVTSASHPNGYNLTNLYDAKLQTSSGLYKGNTLQSISDSLTAQQKQLESQVFADLLKKNAPKELGLDKYFKAQEGRFVLANYLDELNAKKAPQTLFQRAIKKTSQLAGATTGANVGGPFGMFSGYQFGGIMADTFANASNPVKITFLKSIGKSEPEIYAIMKDFASEAELAKSLRPLIENKTGGQKVRESGVNVVPGGQKPIPMMYPTSEANPVFNNFVQNTRPNAIKYIQAPSPRTITPNTMGTPNSAMGGVNQTTPGGLRSRSGGIERVPEKRIFKGGNKKK